MRHASRDGTPVLLPPGLEPAGAVAGVQARRSSSSVKDRLRDARVWSEPKVHKSRALRGQVATFVGSFPATACLVNVGAGDTDYGTGVLNLELAPGQSVDVVGVAEALPLADDSVDGVVLEAVLEHVANAEQTLAELARVLAPGGRAFVDVPFIQGYHASPADYRRYTELGLGTAVEQHGLSVERTGVSAGPGSAMGWIAAEFLAMLLSGRSARVYGLVRPLADLITAPLRFLDEVLDRHPMAGNVASGVFVIARAN